MIRKKKRWKTVILCICMAIVLFLVAKYKQYDDYWEKAGKSYEDMLRLKGEPDSIEDDRGNCIVHYNDMEYCYWSMNAQRPYLIEIRDKDVRFTPFRIGIGTQRNVVEAVYYLKKKEKAYVDEHTYGVTDWLVTIIFEFDQEDRVEKMWISTCMGI